VKETLVAALASMWNCKTPDLRFCALLMENGAERLVLRRINSQARVAGALH
jgi:hypothetical protein